MTIAKVVHSALLDCFVIIIKQSRKLSVGGAIFIRLFLQIFFNTDSRQNTTVYVIGIMYMLLHHQVVSSIKPRQRQLHVRSDKNSSAYGHLPRLFYDNNETMQTSTMYYFSNGHYLVASYEISVLHENNWDTSGHKKSTVRKSTVLKIALKCC